MMSRNLFRLLPVLLLAMLLCSTALAQGSAPLSTNTPSSSTGTPSDAAAEAETEAAAPVDSVPRELVEWMQQMSLTQWGVTVAVFVVMGGGAMVGLYRSANPATQQLIRTGLTAGAGAIDSEAKRRQQMALLNDIDWDDPIWAGIVAGSDKLKTLVARLTPPPAVTTAEAQARAVAKYGVPIAAPLLPSDDDARG